MKLWVHRKCDLADPRVVAQIENINRSRALMKDGSKFLIPPCTLWPKKPEIPAEFVEIEIPDEKIVARVMVLREHETEMPDVKRGNIFRMLAPFSDVEVSEGYLFSESDAAKTEDGNVKVSATPIQFMKDLQSEVSA